MPKLALGKPVGQADAANTGYVPVQKLANIVETGQHSSNCQAARSGMGVEWVASWDGSFKVMLRVHR